MNRRQVLTTVSAASAAVAAGLPPVFAKTADRHRQLFDEIKALEFEWASLIEDSEDADRLWEAVLAKQEELLSTPVTSQEGALVMIEYIQYNEPRAGAYLDRALANAAFGLRGLS